MLRWSEARRPARPAAPTDDPLAAALAPSSSVYSVSRSVFLPRVTLRPANSTVGGVNPIFEDDLEGEKPANLSLPEYHGFPAFRVKSGSSGYESQEGSSREPTYDSCSRLRDDAVAILEQNANYVKSIVFMSPKNGKNSKRSVGSLRSSATGTLTTIPEGVVDVIPRPVWPSERRDSRSDTYAPLADDGLLLNCKLDDVKDNAVKEMLQELSQTINAAVGGQSRLPHELVLKFINERISAGLEMLQSSPGCEEDIRNLSRSLMNSEKVNKVLKAFTNLSLASSNSSVNTEEIYQASGSSSSGFSDFTNKTTSYSHNTRLPVFVHDNISSLPNGVRNAMIYGTLCRNARSGSGKEKLLAKEKTPTLAAKTNGRLLYAGPDEKPSVWELYYAGAGAITDTVSESRLHFAGAEEPFHLAGGRPEVEFTLDLPRSDLLMRKMKNDKKWRCRCRVLTTMLGLVFFLLSVMAVSLILTRGKRMFGSMV